MTDAWPLSLFISSKMQELIEERQALQAALSQYHMYGWLWEKDAGARPDSVRATYLKYVEACDLYIGLFWLGYGPYTIEEYHHARRHNKPCLIYEKHVDIDKRDPLLQSFLDGIGHVENDTGVSICRFKTSTELVEHVQNDVQRLLVERFTKNKARPTRKKRSQGNVIAKNHSISIGEKSGSGPVNQYNNGRSAPDDDEDE
ncbi:MAG TPA: DUF4062 domain-containing protein [Ktedonobacteraceae bacterium]|nr:DUF4062 domain-containing protein [Ktedonobacteraceae bacterium]